jgi:hypothetical protein
LPKIKIKPRLLLRTLAAADDKNQVEVAPAGRLRFLRSSKRLGVANKKKQHFRKSAEILEIMKKIVNPWRNHPEYNCFGCCPNNPIGLHLAFYEDGDYIVSKWNPQQTTSYLSLSWAGIQASED